MAAITLKKIEQSTHNKVKRMQLDREEQGQKRSLEDLYIELIEAGLKNMENRNNHS